MLDGWTLFIVAAYGLTKPHSDSHITWYWHYPVWVELILMLQTIKSLLLGDRSNQYKNIISFVNSFRCQESYVIEECVSSDCRGAACHGTSKAAEVVPHYNKWCVSCFRCRFEYNVVVADLSSQLFTSSARTALLTKKSSQIWMTTRNNILNCREQ